MKRTATCQQTTRRRFIGVLSLCLGAAHSSALNDPHVGTDPKSNIREEGTDPNNDDDKRTEKYSEGTGPNRAIRPPGVVSEGDFLRKCIRCGACITACPEHIIELSSEGGKKWLAPQLNFIDKFCNTDCKKCMIVCPTGAIPVLKSGMSKPAIAAVANVDVTLCLESQRRCGICFRLYK